jgi:hypothetical protein
MSVGYSKKYEGFQVLGPGMKINIGVFSSVTSGEG